MATAMVGRPTQFQDRGFLLGLNLKKEGALKKSAKIKGLKEESSKQKNEDSTVAAPKTPLYPRFRDTTAEPLAEEQDDPIDSIFCKHCKKTILKRTAKDHISGCLKSKQEKARKKKEAREAAQRAKERAERADDEEDEDEDVKDGKRGKLGAEDAKGKKRKAEDDDAKPNKKKKKDDQKPKGAKPKGPVDVERQCGVNLPNGQQCARSLTCKSHSMGAKRAVPGRSLPYDMLLAAYQKKNQARQQKAAIDATAAALYDDDLDNTTGPVDSDEERDAVMTSIQRSMARPQPIATRTLFPTRRKYQLVRMKEMLSNALSGNRGGGLFAVPADAARNAYPNSAINETFAIPSATPLTAGGSQPFRPPQRDSIDVR
ncbi:SAGA complex subunit Sgf73 [Lithohypha guttulata]|uniref:SAGA complex subunit Sgf73 n=1 Tax=Lithohypha guttulata TaxID=1690604 RepID=A0AAN7Y9T5_9EURO|nr:SAGA complex subunit Sgf73 [Lithohypha guttulata]